MKIHNAQYKIDDSSILNYYEVGTEKNKLLLLHAQGTNSCSFYSVVTKLAKHYHVYLVDYYDTERVPTIQKNTIWSVSATTLWTLLKM